MAETRKFYLTTPIYYVNARPHIGHAYSTIVADVIARRHRLLGEDTFFLTGTDEHGQKIERSAQAAGIPPQQFADQVSETFRSLWQRMGITNDDYIRTTEDRHKKGVQKLFALLQEKGHIYLDTYTGQYCVSDEAYVDGPAGVVCPDCGRVTETVSESNYYFRLSAFGERLAAKIESGELLIQPETRRNEVLSFVRGGLKDLSISRTSFKWGIPVPGDESHVIYVWLDALANYMTAIGYGSDDPKDQEKFAKYWPADLHLVGKEIIRFHCVYWPAFLMAAELPLPKSVVANGWLLFEESKMSKSRGNVVRTETILDAFGGLKPELPKAEQDLFGADVLRYFLLREVPFGQDGSFSFDALVQRYNSDLANGYGNLLSRTLTMINKYCQGRIPSSPYGRFPATLFSDGIDRIGGDQQAATILQAKLFSAQKTYLFSSELESIQELIKWVDQYLSEEKPWKLDDQVSEERFKRDNILYNAADALRIITFLLHPFLPSCTSIAWRQLGEETEIQNLDEVSVVNLQNLKWGGLKPGTKLGLLAPIFPRADKGLIQIMAETEVQNAPQAAAPAAVTEAPAAIAAATPAAPAVAGNGEAAAAPAAPAVAETPQIAIDDFMKIDLRVAQILVAERIPKADKLLRLEVDLGTEKRQILSGIAEWYTPEELIGKRIVVIANLAPRKMRGLESHGMLLAASHGENGKPVLTTFGEEIALGARVR